MSGFHPAYFSADSVRLGPTNERDTLDHLFAPHQQSINTHALMLRECDLERIPNGVLPESVTRRNGLFVLIFP